MRARAVFTRGRNVASSAASRSFAAWLAVILFATCEAAWPLWGELPQLEASQGRPGHVASPPQPGKPGSPSPAPRVQGIRIVNVYPHDPKAFTQGLVFSGGSLFESTGLRGQSTLRRVDLKTGRVIQARSLDPRHFAEGLTLWKDRLIQLTWRSGVGFVYDSDSFAEERQFSYEGEGWGITHDGHMLIMSDGSATLRFLDPATFDVSRTLEVTDAGDPVLNLNELEVVKGEILANVWGKDRISRISPETGQVLGWIDLTPLRSALGPVQGIDALNGIAYDGEADRLFVTGKFWPSLFEIEVLP